eukprot:14111971-Ditylum_brightwellii.AAC.1
MKTYADRGSPSIPVIPMLTTTLNGTATQYKCPLFGKFVTNFPRNCPYPQYVNVLASMSATTIINSRDPNNTLSALHGALDQLRFIPCNVLEVEFDQLEFLEEA